MPAAAIFELTSGTAPATPAAGEVDFYTDSADKRLKSVDETPTTRVYVDRDSAETLTTKTLTAPIVTAPAISGAGTITDASKIVGAADATKVLQPSLGGMTAGVTLTLASTQSTSQTLNAPNITATDTLLTTGLAQTVTGVKTLTNPTTAAGTNSVPSMTVTHGANLSNAVADAVENDAVAFYNTVDTTNGRRFDDSWHYFRLSGSGGGITTIADFFGTNDGIPLVANGVYEIEWHCYFSQATAGIATWTIVTATTALATLTGEYVGSAVAGIGAVGTPQAAGINVTSTSSTAFPVTGTEATGATHYFTIRVLLTAGNGASNTRLRLAMSAGTATPLINSYFRVRRLPAGNTGTFVA